METLVCTKETTVTDHFFITENHELHDRIHNKADHVKSHGVENKSATSLKEVLYRLIRESEWPNRFIVHDLLPMGEAANIRTIRTVLRALDCLQHRGEITYSRIHGMYHISLTPFGRVIADTQYPMN